MAGAAGGVYATHMRSEMADILDAMHEAGDCAFDAGVPLIISHHKCAGPDNWGRTQETLPLIDELAKRQEISMDVYPYVAGSTVLREDLVDGIIRLISVGGEHGYRAVTWAERSEDRRLIGYYRTLRAAANSAADPGARV